MRYHPKLDTPDPEHIYPVGDNTVHDRNCLTLQVTSTAEEVRSAIIDAPLFSFCKLLGCRACLEVVYAHWPPCALVSILWLKNKFQTSHIHDTRLAAQHYKSRVESAVALLQARGCLDAVWWVNYYGKPNQFLVAPRELLPIGAGACSYLLLHGCIAACAYVSSTLSFSTTDDLTAAASRKIGNVLFLTLTLEQRLRGLSLATAPEPYFEAAYIAAHLQGGTREELLALQLPPTLHLAVPSTIMLLSIDGSTRNMSQEDRSSFHARVVAGIVEQFTEDQLPYLTYLMSLPVIGQSTCYRSWLPEAVYAKLAPAYSALVYTPQVHSSASDPDAPYLHSDSCLLLQHPTVTLGQSSSSVPVGPLGARVRNAVYTAFKQAGKFSKVMDTLHCPACLSIMFKYFTPHTWAGLLFHKNVFFETNGIIFESMFHHSKVAQYQVNVQRFYDRLVELNAIESDIALAARVKREGNNAAIAERWDIVAKALKYGSFTAARLLVPWTYPFYNSTTTIEHVLFKYTALTTGPTLLDDIVTMKSVYPEPVNESYGILFSPMRNFNMLAKHLEAALTASTESISLQAPINALILYAIVSRMDISVFSTDLVQNFCHRVCNAFSGDDVPFFRELSLFSIVPKQTSVVYLQRTDMAGESNHRLFINTTMFRPNNRHVSLGLSTQKPSDHRHDEPTPEAQPRFATQRP